MQKNANFMPRGVILKMSAKKSFLIFLSRCSFLSWTNFFPLSKSEVFFGQKYSVPSFMNWFFMPIFVLLLFFMVKSNFQ